MRIISWTNKPMDELSEYAARICYNSISKMGTNPTFVNKIIERGHTSTLEHWTAMFAVPEYEVRQNMEEYISLVSTPGVISEFVDDTYYFTINYRHLVEIDDNYFVNKCIKLVKGVQHGSKTYGL